MPYQGPGIYEHYKGGLYYVEGIALSENSLTPRVFYYPVNKINTSDPIVVLGAKGWVRTLSSFNERAEIYEEGEYINKDRFEFKHNEVVDAVE
jgi:hypothetical protein